MSGCVVTVLCRNSLRRAAHGLLDAVALPLQAAEEAIDCSGKGNWHLFMRKMARARNHQQRSTIEVFSKPLPAAEAHGAVTISPEQQSRNFAYAGQCCLQGGHVQLPAVEDAQHVGNRPGNAQ